MMTMRTNLTVLVAALVWVAACGEELNNPAGPDARQDEITRPVPADNTARNKHDAEAGAKTPFDQGQSPEDIQATADIRKAILGMEGMSTNADNVKVITKDGVVTLRGVVEDQAELDLVAEVAKGTAGVTQVDNQLEIDPN